MSTPKDQWLPIEALVYSVEWIEPNRNDFGHYDVVYSYHVGEERYTGQFRDYISESDTYMHRDDVISIRYNPDHATKSFYPEATTATNRRLLYASIGLGLALIVVLIVYLNGGLR